MGRAIMLMKMGALLVALVFLLGGLFAIHWLLDERSKLTVEVERLKKLNEGAEKLRNESDAAESRTLNELDRVKTEGDQRAKELQETLAKTWKSLRDCRIGADTLRVLNRPTSVPSAPTSAAGDRPRSDAVEAGAGTTCEAVVQTFDQNHRQYDLVSVQLNECRAFYNRTRAEYCKITGAC